MKRYGCYLPCLERWEMARDKLKKRWKRMKMRKCNIVTFGDSPVERRKVNGEENKKGMT